MKSYGESPSKQGVPSSNRNLAEQFVGEPILPVVGSFDAGAMSRGEPGIPRGFVWRDQEYAVADVLATWKESGPCRSGSGEQYLRKHWWRITTGNGLEMTIYFERQRRSRGQNKVRWWLFTVAGEEQ